MAIDYSSDVGRVRLRVADISDLPYLPDEVYSQYIADNSGNLANAAKDIACVILGILSFKDHRKLAQLELFGNTFKQYKEFLVLTVTNPAFMSLAPIPYSGSGTDVHPLIQFQNDWNQNFCNGTTSQQLALDALVSPNDGSLYGPVGVVR